MGTVGAQTFSRDDRVLLGDRSTGHRRRSLRV